MSASVPDVDTLLPSQQGVREKRATGERALLAAVLERAVDDLARGSAEVRDWLRDPEVVWPFAFIPLCETLGLDPDAIRDRLLAGGRRAAA